MFVFYILNSRHHHNFIDILILVLLFSRLFNTFSNNIIPRRCHHFVFIS